MQQWIIPTTLNSLQPFKDMELTLMVERVLLLAVSMHTCSGDFVACM